MEPLTSPPPRILKASIDSKGLHVRFEDGRMLQTPLSHFPTLEKATPALRKPMRLVTPRTLRWPKLDYDIGVEGLLAGARERPKANRIRRSKALASA